MLICMNSRQKESWKFGILEKETLVSPGKFQILLQMPDAQTCRLRPTHFIGF